jgi:hypothetical protein
VTSLEQSIRGATGERSRAVRPGERDGAVVVELERPASLVHQVVMLGAQGNEIVEVGSTALLPGDDVVDLASTENS